MSAKIHAVVDCLGNPTGFHVSEVVIADKGYDADECVIEPLQAKGVTVVIPPRRNRKE